MKIVPFMDENLHNSDEKPTENSFVKVFAVSLILIISVVFALSQFTLKKTAEAAFETSPISYDSLECSDFLNFTEEDIVINRKRTFLAGLHPTVTFKLSLSKSLEKRKDVFLLYRFRGEKFWNIVDANKRDDLDYEVVMRDLESKIPYECCFVVISDGQVHKSKVCTFLI